MSWDIAGALRGIEAAGLRRELRALAPGPGARVIFQGREVLNFSSNDYLGLAASPMLRAALAEAVECEGAGSAASRLVCGTRGAHEELEQALAGFKGAEAALSFTSGYAAALGALPALAGRGDTVILDKLSHACLVDAARLSGAVLRVFPHNHLGKLERLLASARGRVLVVTESVFSMDGDRAALPGIIELKERHGAWLLLDEAHAVGVLGPEGRGLAAELGLEKRVELQMGTLSKALGLCGGYIAASRAVADLLVNRARSLIYTTAPPPALARAAVRALEWARGAHGDEARARLWRNIRSLARGLGIGEESAASAILPVILGDEAAAMKASAQLLEQGFLVPAIRYPTVARGSARLRITLSALHEENEVEALCDAVRFLVPPSERAAGSAASRR